MESVQDCVLVRVFTCESAKYNGKPLYEVIIHKAYELGLAGATVSRGILGFGMHHKMHSVKLVELSEDLPLIVDIVDTQENVEKIMPFLGESVKNGLVTIEPLRMIKRQLM